MVLKPVDKPTGWRCAQELSNENGRLDFAVPAGIYANASELSLTRSQARWHSVYDHARRYIDHYRRSITHREIVLIGVSGTGHECTTTSRSPVRIYSYLGIGVDFTQGAGSSATATRK